MFPCMLEGLDVSENEAPSQISESQIQEKKASSLKESTDSSVI